MHVFPDIPSLPEPLGWYNYSFLPLIVLLCLFNENINKLLFPFPIIMHNLCRKVTVLHSH